MQITVMIFMIQITIINQSRVIIQTTVIEIKTSFVDVRRDILCLRAQREASAAHSSAITKTCVLTNHGAMIESRGNSLK